MSEEQELVDPIDTLKEKCGLEAHAAHFKEELDRCTERVLSKTKTTEDCTQELFDYIHAVDHCVSQQLFKHLK